MTSSKSALGGCRTLGAAACLLVAAGAFIACAPRPPAPALSMFAVEWHPRRTDHGAVVGLVERGEELLILSRDQATLMSGGTSLGSVRTVPNWRGGALLPAPDGGSPWTVGITHQGQLLRMRADTRFEPVSDRFGLEGVRVRAACSVGRRGAVFLLDRELAFSDGMTVTRSPLQASELVCGVGGQAASIEPQQLRVFDATGTRAYPMPTTVDVRVALDETGRLFATVGDLLYREDDQHALRRVHQTRLPVTALAATKDTAWFLEGGELRRFKDGEVSPTRGVIVPKGARLSPALKGGLWILAGGGLSRWSDLPPGSPADRWAHEVAPVFNRTCATCHGAGTMIDLASFGAWDRQRAILRRRLLDERSMPPAGVPFPDADRAQVRRWLEAQ